MYVRARACIFMQCTYVSLRECMRTCTYVCISLSLSVLLSFSLPLSLFLSLFLSLSLYLSLSFSLFLSLSLCFLLTCPLPAYLKECILVVRMCSITFNMYPLLVCGSYSEWKICLIFVNFFEYTYKTKLKTYICIKSTRTRVKCTRGQSVLFFAILRLILVHPVQKEHILLVPCTLYCTSCVSIYIYVFDSCFICIFMCFFKFTIHCNLRVGFFSRDVATIACIRSAEFFFLLIHFVLPYLTYTL